MGLVTLFLNAARSIYVRPSVRACVRARLCPPPAPGLQTSMRPQISVYRTQCQWVSSSSSGVSRCATVGWLGLDVPFIPLR